MKLLTQEIRNRIPQLYAQEGKGYEAAAHVKFFTPWGKSTWFAVEFDGEDIFFGWCIVGNSPTGELGYFSLSELQCVNGPFGLKIERDISFDPKPLRKAIEAQGFEVY